MATVTGTNASDPELEGTAQADQIYGLGGNDILIGFGGNDILEGGAGADQLFGSDGFDYASYRGATGTVVLDNNGNRYGDAVGDQLYSIEGIIGSAYGDSLSGQDEASWVLRGEGGADYLLGRGGDDLLDGGTGNDSLRGGNGADELRGGSGADRLAGDGGADQLRGGAGFDVAEYNFSNQAISVDLLTGRGVGGDAQGDRLSGIEGLVGGGSNDHLSGNDANNWLTGSSGSDILTGRGGGDRFIYVSEYDSSPAAPDRIIDFSRAQGDKIDLSAVDANPYLSGDQAFSFIGKAAFTAAGQVHWFQQDGDTVVEVSTRSDGGAEMVIVLDPLFSPQASDFVL